MGRQGEWACGRVGRGEGATRRLGERVSRGAEGKRGRGEGATRRGASRGVWEKRAKKKREEEKKGGR